MKIKIILHKRIAEFKALKQDYHQRLTSVNSYIDKCVFNSLNPLINYVNQQKGCIREYHNKIEQQAKSFCAELYNTLQFTMMFMFSRPAAAGYAKPCDMGTLCI